MQQNEVVVAFDNKALTRRWFDEVWNQKREAAIEEHPAVQSVAVIGLPDDDLGNKVHAIVQTNAPLTPEDLKAHLADKLVSYKQPRSYEFVDEPLRDDAGKVRRTALRDARIDTLKQGA